MRNFRAIENTKNAKFCEKINEKISREKLISSKNRKFREKYRILKTNAKFQRKICENSSKKTKF